jgi:hypothetical protein
VDAVEPASGHDAIAVDLVVTETDLWRFFSLLRRGMLVSAPLPAKLQRLLQEALEIPQAYVNERIQTVFLNGRAVDDIRVAMVTDGDVLTLSAAMPGLVGATLRKGGQLSRLRSSLSHHPLSADIEAILPGVIMVKLFNLVCAELGPAFLHRGVVLPGGHFQEFLAGTWAELAPDCLGVRIDRKAAAPESLPGAVGAGEVVRLKVATPAG